MNRVLRIDLFYRLFVLLAAGGMVVGLTGCPTRPVAKSAADPTKTVGSTDPLRVLVIDDAPLAKMLADQWKSQASEEPLEIKEAVSADLAKARRLSADVVVFPRAPDG